MKLHPYLRYLGGHEEDLTACAAVTFLLFLPDPGLGSGVFRLPFQSPVADAPGNLPPTAMNGSELSKSELPALGIVAGLEEDDRRLRDDLNALPGTYPEPAGHLL